MTNLWSTILRWLALLAVAVLVIGTPIWYHNHELAKSFNKGKVVGGSECEVKHAKIAEEAFAAAQVTLEAESARAVAAEAAAAKARTEATNTRKKLNEALAKTPEVTGCAVSGDALSILRDASNGTFEATGPDSVSGPFTSQLPAGAFRRPI